MTTAAPFQPGIHKLLILGVVTVLTACGGGGHGSGKSTGQAAISSIVPSSIAVSSVVLTSAAVSSVAISSVGPDSQVASSTLNSTSSLAGGISAPPPVSSIVADSSVGAVSSIITSSSVSSVTKDVTPDAFNFTAVTGAALSTNLTSATITISGINTATPISITGGQYVIGNGAPTSNAGTITNGQTVTLTLLTSATHSTTTQAVLSVGGVVGTFSATTVLADTTPDAFNFTGVTTSLLNTATTSNLVTVSGINTAVPISIANGQYSIDGGAFTSAVGTVTNGQTLAVKTISAANINSTTQAILTVGGVAGTFSVAVHSTYLIGGAIQGNPLNIATVVTTLAGTTPNADGMASAARFNNPLGITSDGVNLYIADRDNNSIRKIVIATGIVTTLAGGDSWGDDNGTGLAASFDGPSGIASDGTNLYIADTDNNAIRKIVIATAAVTTLAGGSRGSADGTGTAADFKAPQGITSDGTNLYIADTDNHTIRKIVIATGVVTTLAGSGSAGDADGTGAAASFDYPQGITSDGTNLYIADTYNHTIRKIVIATGVVTTLAGGGSTGHSDGTGTTASFDYPVGITSDGTNLYIADTQNDAIRKIVIATGVVTTLAGARLSGHADGTGIAASFEMPKGITADGVNLYIADTENNTIRKILIATAAVTTLAGSSQDSAADGTGAAASFNGPSSITSDQTNLYIADTWNNRIRKIVIATGVVTTLAGNNSWELIDGTGTAASFRHPRGITSDGTNLYVTDAGHNAIRKIVIETGVVTTLAGGGSSGRADGTGAAASFDYPQGITSDGTNLYIADTYNHTIRKIVLATGVVTTLAGGSSWGHADGTGTTASFDYPVGITSDGTRLYVAEAGNNAIRKIVIATGAVTTLAGSRSWGDADGTGTAASFDHPHGITSDGTNLYIADSSNNSIRKVVIATGVVTRLVGSGSIGSSDGIGAAASFKGPSGITSDGFDLFVTDFANNTIRKIH